MSELDPTSALTRDDREWLRGHGWVEPPPAPRDLGDEMVLDCPRCGAALPIESMELVTFDKGVVGRVAVERPEDVLRRHARHCAPADTEEGTDA